MENLKYEDIVYYMISNKLHRDPFMTIQRLARWLSVNSECLSDEIESGCGQKFQELLNELRVKEAKDLLRKDTYNGFSVDAIGRMAGFNTMQIFYTTFKEKTGYYPQEYKSIKSRRS